MAQIKLGQLADSLRILIKSAETFAPQHFGQMIAIEIVAHYARGGIQLWVAGTLARLAIKQPQHGRNENVQRRTMAIGGRQRPKGRKPARQKVAWEKFLNFCHI